MNIPYLSLQRITAMHHDEIQNAVANVVAGGWYLQGNEIACFEKEYAAYCHAQHCVTCANGLDALTLILRAYKEMGLLSDGDEVIVPANTYIASILAISENNLTPVIVEPRLDTLEIDDSLIEQSITPRTKVLMIVHLYGYNAYTERIGEICKKHNLLLVEDCAQAHGLNRTREPFATATNAGNATTNAANNAGSTPVTALNARAWSFYPGKNLGALGDAGAVTCGDDTLATTIRTIANYGSPKKYVFDYLGRNSRMDEIHAAVLRIKLRYLDADNQRRRDIARRITAKVSNRLIAFPAYDDSAVYHILPVLCAERDRLQQYLKDNGIGTIIHYPIPPHQQQAYKRQGSLVIGNREQACPVTERIHREILSLPCNQTMTEAEVTYLIDKLNAFE